MGREGGRRGGLRRLVLVAIGLVVITSAGPGQASAAGSFSCTATVSTWQGNPQVVANPAGSPCAPDVQGPARQSYVIDPEPNPGHGLSVELYGFTPYQAETRTGPGVASANAVYVTEEALLVAGVGSSVEGASAHASVTCINGTPTLDGRSSLVTGPGLAFDKQVDLPQAGGAILHLNSRIATATEVVQRAIWLEGPQPGPGDDMVFAEARAGFSGNPCTA